MNLKSEFTPELKDSRIVGGSHLAKFAVGSFPVQTLKFCVVEGVEGFRADFEMYAIRWGQWEGFEKGPIEVEEPWPNNGILACGPKSLVGAALPWSNRRSKGSGVEPLESGL